MDIGSQFKEFQNGLFYFPNGENMDPVLMPLQKVSAEIHVGDFQARIVLVHTYKNETKESIDGVFLNPIVDGIHMLLSFEVLVGEKQTVFKEYKNITHQKIADEIKEENFQIKAEDLAPGSCAKVTIQYLINISTEEDVIKITLPRMTPLGTSSKEKHSQNVNQDHSVPVEILVRSYQKCKDWNLNICSKKLQVQSNKSEQETIITGYSNDVEPGLSLQIDVIERSRKLPPTLEKLLLRNNIEEKTSFRELNIDQYSKETCLGRGTFGEVFKYKHTYSYELISVKKLNIEKEPEPRSVLNHKEAERKMETLKSKYYEEIKTMLLLKHPNLLPCLAICKFSEEEIGIVMPLCSKNLDELIREEKISIDDYLYILEEIIKGIQDLHNNQRIHRDIKPENILLTGPSGVDFKDVPVQQLKIQLADFGFSRTLEDLKTQPLTVCGTPYFMPPEIRQYILYNKGEKREYGSKADIYAFGLIARVLKTGIDKDVTAKKELKDVLDRCIDYFPDNRPDADSIYKVVNAVKEGCTDSILAETLTKHDTRYDVYSSTEADPSFHVNKAKRELEELQRSVTSFSGQGNLMGLKGPQALAAELDLCKILRSLKKFQKALPYGEHVMKVREQQLGPDHEATLEAKHELGILWQEMGKKEAALDLQKEVVEKREKCLGKADLNTLKSKQELAYTYGRLRKYNEALQLQEEVEKERIIQLGERHPDTLRIKQQMAFAWKQKGNLQKAMNLLDGVVKVKEEKYGKYHLDTLHTKQDLARVLFKLGLCSEAKEVQKEVYEGRLEHLGEDHMTTLRIKEDLASSLAELGEFVNALKMMREVVQMRCVKDKELKWDSTRSAKEKLETMEKRYREMLNRD